MINKRNTRPVYRRIIFSSALLLSLLSPLRVEAIEETNDETYDNSENEANEIHLKKGTPFNLKEEMDLSLTALDFLEQTKDLHNTKQFEEAKMNYVMMLAHPGLETELGYQIEANLKALENEENFIEWELSEDVLETYAAVTLQEIIDEIESHKFVEEVVEELVEEVADQETLEDSTSEDMSERSDETSADEVEVDEADEAATSEEVEATIEDESVGDETIEDPIESEKQQQNEAVEKESKNDQADAVMFATASVSMNDDEADREAMYQASINGSNASEAWRLALEGYRTYPDDDRFKDAIEQAAARNITWAETLEGRGSYDRALFYYNRVLRAPWLSEETRAYVETAHQRTTAAETEADREAMYQASINGANASEAWSLALEGYRTYPDDDRFKDAIEQAAARNITWAETLEGRGSYDRALFYYNRVLRAPWLSEETRAYVEEAHQRASYGESEAEREAMYQASINGANASEAWSLALEGYRTYPDDDRFKDAIEQAAARNITWAETLEGRGSYDRALFYYNRVLRAPWLSEETRAYVETAHQRTTAAETEAEREAMYQASINGANASEAWNLALEGYRAYPEDDRFKDAIEQAAARNLSWAETLEGRGSYESASFYYNRVWRSPWLSEETRKFVDEAKQRVDAILDMGYLYYQVENAPDLQSKWTIILDGFEEYKNETLYKELMKDIAQQLLDEAIAHHLNKNFNQATEQYQQILDAPNGFAIEKDIASRNIILSKNSLTISQANYHFSYYNSTLSQALDAQMRRAPQTDVNRQWVNASRSQVEYYLNPDNFVNGLNYDYESKQTSGVVNTSALNVRSGSGTSHSAIDMIYRGQKVTVNGSENNWYNISYTKDNKLMTGWVSSSFITVDSNTSETKTLTDAYHPVAEVTATSLNVRTGPSTSNQIVSSVRRGNRFRIVNQENGWYQIRLHSGELGWVSGDFVEVSNSLDRNLMQFLKLSGTSGIKAEELNHELRNSGILANTGHIFIEASKRYNVNENYLMAHAKLETGHGTSRLATGVLVEEVDGKPVTPKVVYNMFGIAAFDNSPLKSGSEYAYKQGWDTVEKSILGGAEWISRQYINHPTHQQDTLYKMRWNPGSPGNHQYATDIGWAVKQTHSLNSVVELSQKYNIPLHFDIPVYLQ